MADDRFASRIAHRRTALGLTQQEVADRMAAAGTSVSHQTIWKWEAGETTPRRTRLPALAAALVLAEETLLAWWLGTDVGGLRTTGRAPSPWEGLFDELSDDARAAIEHVIALDRAARRGGGPDGDRRPAPHPESTSPSSGGPDRGGARPGDGTRGERSRAPDDQPSLLADLADDDGGRGGRLG